MLGAIGGIVEPTMTGRAECHRILNGVRAFLGELDDVMDLKIRQTIISFERGFLPAQFTASFCFEQDPRFHVRVSNMDRPFDRSLFCRDLLSRWPLQRSHFTKLTHAIIERGEVSRRLGKVT